MAYPHKYKMRLNKPMIINGIKTVEMRRIICTHDAIPPRHSSYVKLLPCHSAKLHSESIWGIYGMRDEDHWLNIGWYPAPIEVLESPLTWDLSMLDMARTMQIISDAQSDIFYNAPNCVVVGGELEEEFDRLQSITGIPTNELRYLIGVWNGSRTVTGEEIT